MKNRILFIAVLILPWVSFISCKDKLQENPLIPISQKALSDTSSVFYADFLSYPRDRSQLPIGVFDSSTGGLTVLEALLNLDMFDNITGGELPDGIADFAGENFVYLSDEANMPYGDYESHGKSSYLRELVVKDALFLLGDKYYNLAIDDKPTGMKERVKIIVVACNTASAYGLEDIKKLLDASGTGIKVIGVINAGVRAALEGLDKSKNYSIGVMSTPGTIASGIYGKTIKEISSREGFTGDIKVFNQSGAGFANAVEEGIDYVKKGVISPRDDYRGPVLGKGDGYIDPSIMDRYNFDFSDNSMVYSKEHGEFSQVQLNSASNYARFHLVSLFEQHRKSGSKIPMSSIILGCTHYPFLIDTLNKVVDELRNYQRDGIFIYRNSISKDFRFIDPAQYTAMECYSTLRTDNELAFRPEKGELVSFISVPAYGLPLDCLDGNGELSYDYKFSRNHGGEDISVKQVPFSSRYINQDAIDRIEKLVPCSYYLIKERL